MAAEKFANTSINCFVPLAAACVTEWRPKKHPAMTLNKVPLAAACVTEWRCKAAYGVVDCGVCHSLMPVLLNGGIPSHTLTRRLKVPLADAYVTEWRHIPQQHRIPHRPRATR